MSNELFRWKDVPPMPDELWETFHSSLTCGPLDVRHNGKVRRGHTLRLTTPFQDFEVYVSDTGRSLRVWDRKKGRELK